MAVGDALDCAVGGLDVEGAGGADGDATEMTSCLFAGRNSGGDDVAGAEAEVAFGRGEVAAWEAVGGEAGTLAGAAHSNRRDRPMIAGWILWRRRSFTHVFRSIER